MHWTPEILTLADSYVRQALVIAPYEPTPPYIAVHVRHGDFGGWCGVPLKDCFAPLSVIARRVEEVQDELLQTKRLVVDRVVVTSDEQDSAWWEEVLQLGWVRPDHSRTVEVHGAWYAAYLWQNAADAHIKQVPDPRRRGHSIWCSRFRRDRSVDGLCYGAEAGVSLEWRGC
ncbi:hypothetical protein GGX14DRAFT_6107 [Mycena pura]|uniref:Uncharacterized protein n=1 Tax=Mycena pura TaxID=153505 RepID=A0AAD6YVW1_9AGAR|nr:hypothetical protein GGX14DRAFT_6107 [Mycena pura]